MRSPRAIFSSSIAAVRDREAGRLPLMAVYLLLIITCYTITKAVRDSLFIIEVGPKQLPYLYVMSGAAMALVSSAYPSALRRMGLYSFIRLTSIIAVSCLVAFWWLTAQGATAWFYVLYVWVSLFGATAASQAWSLANHIFDAREARRSFAWIGLGGVTGGIAGGVVTKIVAARWGTEVLLLICAPLMALSIYLLHRLTPRDAPQTRAATRKLSREESSVRSVITQIWNSRYLSMIVALLVTGVIVEAFIDYEFKWISHRAFTSKNELTSFFGTIAFYGGVLALVVQTILTSRLLKRFGVGATILILPSAFLAAFLLVAARPALWAVSIMKLIDGSLSHSVHRSGMELLYVPVSEKQRAAIKGLIDLLVDRAGRALGGAILLVLTFGLALSITWLSLIAAAFLVGWIVIAILVRHDYVDAFRAALEKKVVQPEALAVRSLDLTMIRSLVQALSSRDDRQVLYALDLLAQTHPRHWKHSLPALLRHDAAAVRSRTIALLAKWRNYSSALVAERLVDPDVDVRAEAIHYLCVTAPRPAEALRGFLNSSDYQIVLAAVHYITKYGASTANLIDEQFIERAMAITGEDALNAKIAAARMLALVPGKRANEVLERLLADSSPEVVRAAVRAVAHLRYEAALPRLISLLRYSRLRLDARKALLELGAPAVAELQRQLQDVNTPIEIRVRIPKILSYVGTQDAANLLLDCIHTLTPRLNMSLLKGLNRIRKSFPTVSFDVIRVSSLIDQESQIHHQWSMTLASMESDPSSNGAEDDEIVRLLKKTLREKMDECVERTFRLLALIYPPDDVYSTYFSFVARPTLRGSAVEFLDNLLEPALRASVVPMVEDDMNRMSSDSDDAGLTWSEAMNLLAASGDRWLTAIAQELSQKTSFRNVSPRIA